MPEKDFITVPVEWTHKEETVPVDGTNEADLITNVPGNEHDKVEQPATPREIGSIALNDGEFRGDPRRVLGHPSNLTNDMASAYLKRR